MFSSSEERVRLRTEKAKQRRACLKGRLTKKRRIRTMMTRKSKKKDLKMVKKRKMDKRKLLKNSQKFRVQRQMKVKPDLSMMHQ